MAETPEWVKEITEHHEELERQRIENIVRGGVESLLAERDALKKENERLKKENEELRAVDGDGLVENLKGY